MQGCGAGSRRQHPSVARDAGDRRTPGRIGDRPRRVVHRRHACPIGPETWPPPMAAAAGALAAADEAACGRTATRCAARRATTPMRPGPAGIATSTTRRSRRNGCAPGRAGVAVLDIDSHHGNGTQGLFWNRGDVLFTSVHGDPHGYYPWYVGHADELGAGAGAGFNRNFPLAAGTEDLGWLAALDAALRAIDRFGADALVVSLGFDASRDEPLHYLSVSAEGFARAGAAIGAWRCPPPSSRKAATTPTRWARCCRHSSPPSWDEPRPRSTPSPSRGSRRCRWRCRSSSRAACRPSWWSACPTRRSARRASGCGRR